ncbi:hypothetical protein LTR17_002039 [Elasticomyces elasticus]|nr:hypothetical protein LTR17_002039 [Elasticomyces elasticus]
MAFFFTCGTHNFRSALAGYENVTAQCQNCGNFTGKVVKNWSASSPLNTSAIASVNVRNREWFTLCFVPLIPFSLKPWHAVHCNVCNFQQDIKFRPDVEQQMNGGGGGGAGGAGGGGGGGGQAIPMQNQGAPNQGWNRPPPPPPPGQGIPQYK